MLVNIGIMAVMTNGITIISCMTILHIVVHYILNVKLIITAPSIAILTIANKIQWFVKIAQHVYMLTILMIVKVDVDLRNVHLKVIVIQMSFVLSNNLGLIMKEFKVLLMKVIGLTFLLLFLILILTQMQTYVLHATNVRVKTP